MAGHWKWMGKYESKALFTLHVGPGKLCAFCVNAKHVPGLIPGWDLVTLPGSVPERALCEQKPDQCRNECVVVMTHFVVQLFLPCVFEGRSTFTRWKMCKLEWSSNQGAPHYLRWSWNHSPVSEMVSAHYTRHMKGHVSLRDLYGLCVNARTYSRKSLAVWMQQIWWSGNKCRNTLPVYFPESLCERASEKQLVFRRMLCLQYKGLGPVRVWMHVYSRYHTHTHTHLFIQTIVRITKRYLAAIRTYFTRWLICTNSYDLTRTI